MKVLILINSIFLFSLSTICAQTNVKETPLISTKALAQDFLLLRTALEKTHAGLYTYTPKDRLDLAFETIANSLNHPMTSIEFFRKISPLLEQIGNGHTNFLIPPDYRKALDKNLPRFPFAIYEKQDTLYILRNLSEELSIQPGFILNRINGEKASTVLTQLAENLTRDGYNTSWPKGRIIKNFSGFYAVHKGTPKQFEIEITNLNGQSKSFLIKGLTTQKIIEFAKKRYPPKKKTIIKSKLPLTFNLSGNIGLLKVQSFSKPIIKKSGQQYKDFFKQTFQQIEANKTQHLIIDLRNNGGGWPEVVQELFQYLTDSEYRDTSFAYTLTKNLPNQKHYKNGFWEFLDMKKSLKLKKEGTIYKVIKRQENKPVQPAKNNFQGELYILINPFSLSATTDFLGMLKNINRGVFIGETAGGSPHRVTSWLMPVLVLPNTKIEAIIPLVHTETQLNYQDDGLGISPHFFVKNSIQEAIQGKDSVMQFTLDLIKQSKEK